MQIQSQHVGINSINRMLFEMATGNLAFRMELDNGNDALDEIATLLNAVAEKIELAIAQHEHENAQENNPKVPTLQKQSDAALIQNVYDYILNNLQEPLPSTKELAHLFGSNEFKLKESFKKFFKTSVYQFYNEERLKLAHALIQQTMIPLKDIPFMCGFNSYLNFYKAFRKKYSYAPSELSRLTNKG